MKRILLSFVLLATVNAAAYAAHEDIDAERTQPSQPGWWSNLSEAGLHKLTAAARYLEKKADALNEYTSSKLGTSPTTTSTIAAGASYLAAPITGGIVPTAAIAYAFAKHLRDKWSSMNDTQKKEALTKVQDLVEEAHNELNETEEKVHSA
jgi:hypothetical protein